MAYFAAGVDHSVLNCPSGWMWHRLSAVFKGGAAIRASRNTLLHHPPEKGQTVPE
jgi:hypothetical protein